MPETARPLSGISRQGTTLPAPGPRDSGSAPRYGRNDSDLLVIAQPDAGRHENGGGNLTHDLPAHPPDKACMTNT